jgi:hypothetical protein
MRGIDKAVARGTWVSGCGRLRAQGASFQRVLAMRAGTDDPLRPGEKDVLAWIRRA